MATDFWASSHYKRWIVDRSTLKQARADDLVYVPASEYLDFFTIYFANLITKLCKKLQLRQRVVATATVFFHRFYLKNSYCETDPYLVLSACCYVAAKAEESPVHIKNIVTDSRTIFSQPPYNVKHFPSDNSKLAEMEFYLVDDLECDLVVFHPYRTLLALCKKESSSSASGGNADMVGEEAEAGELGTGIGAEDGPRYWGTGEGKLELSEAALQTAWFIINDTYRSAICLLYPPHLIAVTAIYLTLVLHIPTQNSIAHLIPYSPAFNPDPAIPAESSQPTPQLRRSSRSSDSSSKQAQQDPIDFLANLNVSLSVISTIAQEIISMYSLWNRYSEEPTLEEARNPHIAGGIGKRNVAGNPKNAARGHRMYQNAPSQTRLNPSASTSKSTIPELEHQRRQNVMQLQHAGALEINKRLSIAQKMGLIPPPYFMQPQPQHQQLQRQQQQVQQQQHPYPPVLAPVSLGSLSPTKRFSAGTGTGAGSGTGTGSGSGSPSSAGAGGRMEDLFGDGTGSGSPASHTSQLGPKSGSGNTPGSLGGGETGTDDASSNSSNQNPWSFGQGRLVTAAFLSDMLNSMREARMSDMAHPSSGRPIVVNRMLERTG
ncbi:cyclin-like protein [Lentinula raphanica]|nr:cyclin-like protein [Lentinula raphanica]